jgi:hypothetical protein
VVGLSATRSASSCWMDSAASGMLFGRSIAAVPCTCTYLFDGF